MPNTALPRSAKAGTVFRDFVTDPAVKIHPMTRARSPLSALQPVRPRAASLFGMIVVSALAIAVILASSTAQVFLLRPSLHDILNILVATLIVAGSIACLAVQYDGQTRALEEAVPADPLTGLVSARYLALAMSRGPGGAGGRHPVSCVAVFEIDHFEKIRDISGGAFADEVVRWVAGSMFAKLRSPFDKLARIENGLFIAVLADTTVEQAETICERLLVQLREAAADVDTRGRRLSLSFGVASFLSDTPFEEARDEAVAALLEARRFGRNQVRSRTSVPVPGNR